MSQVIGQITVEVTTRVAWWIVPYLRLLRLFILVTGMEPDHAKVDRMIRRAITVEVGNIK